MTNQKAIKVIEHIVDSKCLAIGNFTLFEEEREAMKIAIEALKQSEQRKGKWINPSQNPGYVNKEFFYDCSVCGFTTMQNSDICPCCKARMEGEE